MGGRAVIMGCLLTSLNLVGGNECLPQEARSEAGSRLGELAYCLTGSFTTAQQAAADSAFADVRLRVVRIWKVRDDGYWFYVEQAPASREDRPYRQRVYQLVERNDTTFESIIYTLPSPERFAGEWRKANPLADLHIDSLSLRNGCSVILHPRGDSTFVGATVGKGCPSLVKGAAYTISQVVLTPTAMVSWDRGYRASGTQVWGSFKGGYLFQKTWQFPLD